MNINTENPRPRTQRRPFDYPALRVTLLETSTAIDMAPSGQPFRLCPHKPRVFIVSDISNEPDDAESLVRYLLYSNEFDTRGLVACTSTWLKRNIHPEDMRKIVDAYATVVDRLNKHVHPDNQYPSAEYIHSIIAEGPKLYGAEALKDGVPLSEGSKLLIDRLDEASSPLWVLCWGGTNVLAQALQHVTNTRSPEDAARLRSKIRVYAISDQDDTGAWIRRTYPDIFYIASVHAWNQYGFAAWSGISGDEYYGFDRGGPDSTKISRKWIAENIQVGPLGKAYPDPMFIAEGDTPTYLYLIQNGLGHPEHPEWGSWGGRYSPVDASIPRGHFADVADRVTGKNGQLFLSNHASIWRWRDAFQDSFAARIQWTLTDDPTKANHAPIAIVNDSTPGPEPLYLEAEAGSEVQLDASKSYDPDGDELSFHWMHYREVTATNWGIEFEVEKIDITDLKGARPGERVSVRMPPPEKCAIEPFSGKAVPKGQIMHFVLAVTDSGTPCLTTYKRVVIQITNEKLLGGRGKALESIADVRASVH